MKKLTIGISLLIALLSLSMFAAIPTARALPTDLTHLQADRIGEPQDIDPAWAYDTLSSELIMNVYDPLLWFNRTNIDTFIPRLATSWTIENINQIDPVTGLLWVVRINFTLRTGVHFQDTSPASGIPGAGALLTPQDVEYTFERLLVTDASTGPSWMLWKPLFGNYSASDLNQTLYNLDPIRNMINPATRWDYNVDEAIDDAVQSDATHVWFNLVMPYEPILQTLSQSWGSIMNQAWCAWHGDWPGRSAGDNWYLWHDPATSPLYSSNPASPGPHLDAALGTGQYILDYWNKGAGNVWSIIRNDPSIPGIGSTYWEGWTVPFRHQGWGPGEPVINGHVDRYTSYYIPAWTTRRLRFLGGVSDFCDVPRNCTYEVSGWPGIECIYPLPQLVCDTYFFNYLVSGASLHLGLTQPLSTFNPLGAPPNIMQDKDFRLAIAHMFNYASYLEAAFLNESISPVTPIIPGLACYDPSIGQEESPALNQRKKYGITGEPADTLAYNMTLAVQYLRKSWGGALWATGFTMDVVYDEGNFAGEIAAKMIRDAFNWVNANYATKFTINVLWLTWSAYWAERIARVMPLYIASWQADFADAYDFAHPFIHSEGALSKFQGYLGVTSFPNSTVDWYIDTAIESAVPSVIQACYTWLQQYYVDNALGFVLSQPIGRHWQRDWVKGWYYNPLVHGNYVCDLWKAITVTVQNVDVEITNFVCPTKIELGSPVPTNPVILPFPSPISVTAHRKDANAAVPSILVIISVSLRDASNMETVLNIDFATLSLGGSYTADFFWFIQDSSAPITPGVYTCIARVRVASGFGQDTDLSNNELVQASPVTASIWLIGGYACDVNVDGTIDMADISICIDAFMSVRFPPSWNWDVRCDVNSDFSVDMADVSILAAMFMASVDH